jgi:hypothetical protein
MGSAHTVIDLQAGDPGIIFHLTAGVKDFFLPHSVQTGSGAHPPRKSVCTETLSTVANSRPVSTLPSNTNVKREWSYTSPPPYAFAAYTGVFLPFYLLLNRDAESGFGPRQNKISGPPSKGEPAKNQDTFGHRVFFPDRWAPVICTDFRH